MAQAFPFRIGVFQSALGDAASQALLAALDQALAEAAREQAALLVCPELLLGGYRAGKRYVEIAEARDGPFARAAAALAARHGVALAYGFPEAADGVVYNSALVLGADGARVAHHRKQRLPGDYEKQWFTPAHGLTLFSLGGFRVGLIICYEMEFPEVVRACARNGAELVIVPTALSAEWPVVARHVVPARAFENGAFLAYANHAGVDQGYHFLGESCIVGPQGQELARAGAQSAVITATLDYALVGKARARIPFLDDSEGLASF